MFQIAMSSDDAGDRTVPSGYSRRDALKAASTVAGTTLIAGCSGGSGGGGSGTTESEQTTTTSGSSDTSATFRWPSQRGDSPLTDHETNPFNAKAPDETIRLIYARLGGRSLTTGKWMNLDETGWEFDEENNEQRLTIKDDVYWHQGTKIVDPVNAHDWKLTAELGRRMVPKESRAEEPLVTGWRVEGKNDKTLVRELNKNGWNRNLAEELWRVQIDTYRKGWAADKLEELKSATTKKEKNKVRSEIKKHSVKLSEDPILSGPWMVENVNPNEATFKRNPKHWSNEATNYNKLKLLRLGGGQNAGFLGLKTDRIDMNAGSLPASVKNAPKNIKQVSSAAGASYGLDLIINYGGDKVDPILTPGDSDVVGTQPAKVRQAISLAIDPKSIVKNEIGPRASSSISPYPKQTLIGTKAAKQRFPDVVSKLESTLDPQPEKAQERLRAAGLSKEDGTWVKPDGKPLKLELQSFPWSRSSISTIKEDLNAIGIKAEHTVMESSVLFSQLTEGSFSTAQTWHSADGPYESEVRNYFKPGSWPDINRPQKFKIPPTIGDYEGEATETVDAVELTNKLAIQSTEKNNEILPKLIWTFAYHLPGIILHPGPNSTTINTQHFDWPEPVPEVKDGVAVATDEHHPIWGVTENWRQLRRGVEGLDAKTK